MAAKVSFQDISILLVEPSAAQGRIILERLRSVGLLRAELVRSGHEALESMAAALPDLVLSAMYFDDMTGAELIEAIREDARFTAVPFMLISSESNTRTLDPIRQAGVTAILPKPFDLDALKKALRATLDFIEPERLELGDVEVEDLRVLVVDDSRWALRHITRTLEQMGIERISHASNGREAAELIRDQQFDLVVTDYNMPEMDGGELVQYIRHLSNQPDLPILMVTSESKDSRLAAVEQAGMSALVDKPFDINVVRELLKNLLNAA